MLTHSEMILTISAWLQRNWIPLAMAIQFFRKPPFETAKKLSAEFSLFSSAFHAGN